MADGWVLIDTSAWIHALRPSGLSQVRERVRDVLTTGRAATCEMVLLELAGGTRTEREYRELIEDLGALRQLAITDAVWGASHRLAHSVRRSGLTVPSTDHLIAAVALTYGCRLLHRDRHFDLLADRLGLPLRNP